MYDLVVGVQLGEVAQLWLEWFNLDTKCHPCNTKQNGPIGGAKRKGVANGP